MIENKEAKEISEMVAELEEYYENAGFADVYRRVFAKMDEVQIRDNYRLTFEVAEEKQELAEWEQKEIE